MTAPENLLGIYHFFFPLKTKAKNQFHRPKKDMRFTLFVPRSLGECEDDASGKRNE